MTNRFDVRDLHPAFGSEVIGLDLQAPLDDTMVGELRALFDERGLVLVREPDLSLARQRELSFALIGRPVPADLPERARSPYFVSNKEPEGGAPFGRLLFHSDGMWMEHPFELLSLYAVEVAPPVAPTVFVSTAHAWVSLPDDLRARVEPLHVEHGHYAYDRGGDDGDVLVSTFEESAAHVTAFGHPHPRTGAPMLYASQMMTTRVVELDTPASEALLDEVFDHLYAPERVLEHTWGEGDLVLWDNLAVQHARPNVTVEGPVRTLRKVFAPLPDITDRTQKPRQRTRAAG